LALGKTTTEKKKARPETPVSFGELEYPEENMGEISAYTALNGTKARRRVLRALTDWEK